MSKELLKELLGDLYTDEIGNKLGDKKLAVTNDGSWIPKAKFDEANEANKNLKQQITDRDKQLETLKGQATGNEELKSQIEQLQSQNTELSKKHEADLYDLRFNQALDSALKEAEAKNPKAVKALMDISKIKLDGEQLLGLKEQLDPIKTSDAYLFGSNTGGGQIGGGTNPPGGGANSKDLQTQYDEAMKTGNASLAISLKNQIFGLIKDKE